MPSPTALALCAAASLALLLIPGPAVLFIVTRSAEHGRRVGLASVLGVHLGTLVHVAAAVAGLSALLVSSAAAFSVVKYAGAAYLIALGLHRSFGRAAAEQDPLAGTASVRRAVVQGAVVNVLNPKVALFFLAFLPPFVDPHRGPVATQVVVLGLLYVVLGVCSDGAYALAAAAIARRLKARAGERQSVVLRGRRASGIVYLALGALAALTPRHAAG